MPATLKNLSTDRQSPENITVLVSPHPDDQEALTTILEADSWKVKGACSCQEALSLLSQGQEPAVVACDSKLPDGDWKDLFYAINSLRNPPALVVLSRHADEFLWAEVLNVGGYDLLAKPFDPQEVHRVMSMAREHGVRSMAS